MERLTKRERAKVEPDIEIVIAKSGVNIPQILERLAAYEDTGLTPEEIKEDMPDVRKIEEKLAGYEDAEANGLLVRLPCKVGDTVYAIEDGEILEDVIFEFNYGRRSDGVLTALFECADNGVSFYSDDFGKRVFFSIEEAEAALAKETAS